MISAGVFPRFMNLREQKTNSSFWFVGAEMTNFNRELYKHPGAFGIDHGLGVEQRGLGAPLRTDGRFLGRNGLHLNLLRRVNGSFGGGHGGSGLNFNFLEGLEPNVYAANSHCDQSDSRKYLWPILRILLGICLLYHCGRIAYAGGDSRSRYSRGGWGLYSYFVMFVGGILLLLRAGW